MADGISIREFAWHERVSDTLMHQALKRGRLAKRADGLMDAALVGTGWRASEAMMISIFPRGIASGVLSSRVAKCG
jgi:hypothetical protein